MAGVILNLARQTSNIKVKCQDMSKMHMLLLLDLFMAIFLFCTSCHHPRISNIEDDLMTNGGKYFEHNDSKIWYLDKGSGETFLFVHGFASSSYTWRYFEKYYSGKYRIISIDLKGFGKSSKPHDESYSVKEQSVILTNFIKKNNLCNVTMVGHSFGGAVILFSYITAEEEVKKSINKLILIDSAAYRQDFPDFISILRIPIINWLTLSLMPDNINSKTVLKESFFDHSKITDEMINTYASYLNMPGAHHALIQTAKNIVPDDIDFITSKYKDISIPVLIIWGEEDQIVKKSIGVRLHNEIPGSSFESIKKCGHIPQEECPGDALTIIDNFIKTNK